MALLEEDSGDPFLVWSSNVSSRDIDSPIFIKRNAVSHFLPPIPCVEQRIVVRVLTGIEVNPSILSD